ncbi:MAG: PKD domain-containing protein [Bacteroidia bacterium]|nr:PKD domain-containing protein [Bacteroidia bacterium]
MKKIFYLALVLPLIIFSCQSTPEAHFYTDTIEPEVGHKVLFTNDSHNAKRFEWDFGDGFISNEESPNHIFNITGIFEVTLTAISKSGLDDKATLTLEVIVPTLLEIEVLEYYNETPVADASVYLFSSISDWEKHSQNNLISEGYTDGNGIIVFSNLDPLVYFVDVWEQNYDNYAFRNEINYLDYLSTPVMLPHQINKFIAWVDYYADKGIGEGRGTRSVIIKKLERKVTEKRQPAEDSGTEGWQELYNRRAGQ